MYETAVIPISSRRDQHERMRLATQNSFFVSPKKRTVSHVYQFSTFRMIHFNVIVCMVVVLNALNNGVYGLVDSVVPTAKDEVLIPKKCVYDRIYGMLGADCAKMDLKDVPTYLRSNIGVSQPVAKHIFRVSITHTHRRGTTRTQSYITEMGFGIHILLTAFN